MCGQHEDPYLDAIADLIVPEGALGVVSLGQAGFLLKSPEGKLLAVDPYLTDSAMKAVGFKRLTPMLFDPWTLPADALLVSHDHPDHFDAETVPALMARRSLRMLCAADAFRHAQALGLDTGRITAMRPGDRAEACGFGVTAVPCDHGELAPDALGFLIACGPVTVYYPGDTAYAWDRVRPWLAGRAVDIILPPINGAYGNLDAPAAARLTLDAGAAVCVPCHYWTFREHLGNPQQFYEEMRRIHPACDVRFMVQGETFAYRKS